MQMACLHLLTRRSRPGFVSRAVGTLLLLILIGWSVNGSAQSFSGSSRVQSPGALPAEQIAAFVKKVEHTLAAAGARVAILARMGRLSGRSRPVPRRTSPHSRSTSIRSSYSWVRCSWPKSAQWIIRTNRSPPLSSALRSIFKPMTREAGSSRSIPELLCEFCKGNPANLPNRAGLRGVHS